MNTHAHETMAGGTDHGGGRRRSLWKGPALVTALILLIPLLGDRFYGWGWEFPAFVRVGALLFGTGLIYELITRNVDTIAYRAAVGIALAAAFLLVGVNFVQRADAVNPAAVVYLWVPLVGILGAAKARFRPEGMSRALFSTALAQVLALGIALMIRNSQNVLWSAAVLRGFVLNALFGMLFVGSALLLRKAARGASPSGVE
jgi:hypothetical protein